MNSNKLSIQDIELRRMPGFPSGGFRVSDLSSGVNIIFGPNGSGKSTLCRAICKLLRPTDPPHEDRSLFAMLQIDDQQFSIDVDFGRLKCQCDGIDVELPTLAPAELQHGYVLALHDLISADDGGDLAAQIVRESAGGFDLKRPGESLKFRVRPRGKSNRNKELKVAKDKANDALAEQETLLRQESELIDLRTKRDKASDAKAEFIWIGKALDLDDAKMVIDESQQRLNVFPPGIGNLNGTEATQLTSARQSIDEWQRKQESETDRCTDALEALAASILPEDGVQSQVIGELRLKCSRLDKLATSISKLQQDMARSNVEREQASIRLGDAGPSGSVDTLDAAEVEQLLEFVGQSEKNQSEQYAETQLREWLGTDEQLADLDALNKAIDLLREWRAVQSNQAPTASPRTMLLIAAAACGLLGIIFAILFHWSWLLMLFATAGLLTWAFVPKPSDDRLDRLQRDFDALPLHSMSKWSETVVAERLWQLQQLWCGSAVGYEKQKRWEGLTTRLERLQQQCAKLDIKSKHWATRLELSEDKIGVEAYLLASRLREVQLTTDRCRGAQAELRQAEGDHSSLSNDINKVLRHYNLPEAANAEQAAATVEQLEQLREAHAEFRKTVKECRKNLPEIKRQIDRAKVDIAKIFAGLGLDENDDTSLRQWLEQRDDFLKAARKVEDAKVAFRIAESAVKERADLSEASRDKLTRQRDQFQLSADQWENLNEQIIGIETLVTEAKKKTDLEASLASHQRCEDQLRVQREEDCDAVVGDVWMKFLSQLERGAERSQVFQRSAELFVEITHGRYKLLIDNADPPAFRAFDTDRQMGLALEELSSGTRLQLLLAARVAFVEQQESQWKLPLVFDEALANSDERRAELIIDAAIKLCQNGRQVFYFTAQHDEVGKWQTMLNRQQDVPSRLIDLAEVRGFSETERVPPMQIQAPGRIEIPKPGNSDWHEYGRQLKVPTIDPHREIGGLHLWYLIDDVEDLHRLLRQGVNRWGQLQTLIEYGQGKWLTTESTIFQRARAAADVLCRAVECWRIGRGRPVDRDVLLRSGCVTPKFIDAVVELAKNVGDDSQALIESLQDGDAKGFQTKKRDELAEYLQMEGYLDDRDVLTSDQILDQVRPVAFDSLDRNLIDLEKMEELVNFVVRIGERQQDGLPDSAD